MTIEDVVKEIKRLKKELRNPRQRCVFALSDKIRRLEFSLRELMNEKGTDSGNVEATAQSFA